MILLSRRINLINTRKLFPNIPFDKKLKQFKSEREKKPKPKLIRHFKGLDKKSSKEMFEKFLSNFSRKPHAVQS